MLQTLIEFANSYSDQWAAWLLAVTLDTTFLFAVLGTIWFAIRKRVAPQVGYALFFLIPLKLLLPLSITAPASIAQWTPSSVLFATLGTSQDRIEMHNDLKFDTSIEPVPLDPHTNAKLNIESHSRQEPGFVPPSQLSGQMDVKSRQEIESAGVFVPQSLSHRPSLSVKAILLLFWLVGVLVLGGRFIFTHLRFQSHLRLSSNLNESRLGLEFRGLCRRAGLKHAIDLVENDCVAAPAVWGIFRPTIILPRGLVDALTPQQLRWVLLHELAHIQRRDLVTVVVQRLAAILHFFNPVIWIANRIIHRLREYACDDYATAVNRSTAVESGEAFLQVLRHVNRNQRGLEGALGILGWDSRAACFLRVQRLLDAGRPSGTRIGPGTLTAVILMALFVLPNLRAGDDRKPTNPPAAINTVVPAATTKNQPETTSGPRELLAKDTGEFQLRVVGPDGKPVPQAQIDLRFSPAPVAEQIRQGTFVKKSTYGTMVTTDSQGLLVLSLPKIPSQINANITTPGFGPYWARWSSETLPIPAKFTAELEAGWTAGGIIVDDAGKPIEGAEVHPNIEYKKRSGDDQQLGLGATVKSDAAGKWHFESVPVSESELFVEINHPNFMPNRRSLPRTKYGIKRDQGPVSTIEMNRGLTVTGTVTDEVGKPIEGVLVRTKLINNIRETRTGADGVYRLSACEPSMAKIVVSAKGRATDMQQVRIDAEMPPVDFRMQPGGKIRVHVVDHLGKPSPNARIFFQHWRGRFSYFEFNHVSQYADKNGVWAWDEAPLDEFRADICPSKGMTLDSQPLIARAEPHVIQTPPMLIISGKVIDAVTRKPISKFHAISGSRSERVEIDWERTSRFTATDGTYRLHQDEQYSGNFVRIEAEGYIPGISREIKSDEGTITIDFELKPGNDVAARVLSPNGTPATDAEVALGVAGSQISIKNGALQRSSTRCALQQTDASGQFRFPPQDTPYQLVILHPTGYAHLKFTPDTIPTTIQLEPWARVEGIFKVGKTIGRNVQLNITTFSLYSYGEGVPRIYTDYALSSDQEGRFVFERVVPGKARIGRRIELLGDVGATEITSTSVVTVQLPAGETTRLDLGGTGHAVIGKLVPPKGFQGKVNWRFANINVKSDIAHTPPPEDPVIPEEIERNPTKKAEWMLTWQQSVAGKVWLARKAAAQESQMRADTSPVYMATIGPDGTFRIDDLPAGNYVFSAIFSQQGPGLLQNYRFTVPLSEVDPTDETLNLGILTLTRRE